MAYRQVRSSKSLPWTDKEICYHFKRNGCYPGMVHILAELNATTENVILKILEEGGLSVDPSASKPDILHEGDDDHEC